MPCSKNISGDTLPSSASQAKTVSQDSRYSPDSRYSIEARKAGEAKGTLDSHKAQEARHRAPEGPLLSFLPAGRIRSVSEHLVAGIAGALLLFFFFMASEIAVLVMKDTKLMSITFVPVICLLPLLAGALAAIVFEKLRRAQPNMRQGALVGALAGFFGSSVSAVILIILSFLNMNPLGDALASPLIVAGVLIISVGLDTILSALGGALVVKFTS
jgi:hypothetical protein